MVFDWFRNLGSRNKRAAEEKAASTGGEGQEFFRAWSHEGQLVVKLDADMFDKTQYAGIFVADVARHFARAFVQAGRVSSEAEALLQIREAFEAEWVDPTDPLEGSLIN